MKIARQEPGPNAQPPCCTPRSGSTQRCSRAQSFYTRSRARSRAARVMIAVVAGVMLLSGTPSLPAEEPLHGESRTITASDGSTLAYVAYEPQAPDAAIILYHRAGAHAQRPQYRNLAERLSAEHNLAVYLVDIRGHGASDGGDGRSPSINRLLTDIRELQDSIRSETDLAVYLLGHSDAAGLLTNYAVYPGRREPSGYIFLAPKLGARSTTETAAVENVENHLRRPYVLAAATAGVIGGRQTALEFYRSAHEIEDDPQLLSGVSRNVALAFRPRAPQAQFNRIARPTAIIVGAEDELINYGRVLAYRNLLPASVRPHSRAEELAGADHETAVSAAVEVVAEAVEQWETSPTIAVTPERNGLAARDTLDPNPHRSYRKTRLALFASSLAEYEARLTHERARRLHTTSEPLMLENYTGVRLGVAAGASHGELSLSGFARPISALELALGARAATGWSLDGDTEGLRTAGADGKLDDDPHGAILLKPYASAELRLDARRFGAGEWFALVARLGAQTTRTTLLGSDAEYYEYRMTGRRGPGWCGTLSAFLGYEPPLMLSRLGVEAERTTDRPFDEHDDNGKGSWYTTVRPVLVFSPAGHIELHGFLEFTDREINDEDRSRSRADSIAVYRAGLTLSWWF